MAQALQALVDKCVLCNTKEKVNYYCINCQEILCLACKSSHSESRQTRNDTIIPLSQARRDDLIQAFCSDHSTVEVNLFCLKCDTLICNQCLAEKHKSHVATTPDEIKDAKAEELKKIIKILQDKKSVYDNAFDNERQVHSQFSKSIGKAKDELSDQKNKIIEELNVLCDEQNAELAELQQNEDKRYADACNKIQEQSQILITFLEATKNILAKNNAALIIKTTKDATSTIHGLEEPNLPCAKVASYQPGDRSRPAIRKVQGKVNIQQEFISKRKKETDKHKAQVKIQQQQQNEDHKQGQEFDTPRIDVSKAIIKSTLKLTGRDIGRIDVIVPMQNKSAWVAAYQDTHLSLIDNEGNIIYTSVVFETVIADAKAYRKKVLVTCCSQCKIFTMSEDGLMVSTFSDLSPYKTRGMCITADMSVMVCLQSIKNKKDNKIVMLGSSGDRIQSFQYVMRVPLYKDPWYITSLPTGELIVIDWEQPNKLIGMKEKKPSRFTLDWEIQEKGNENYSFRCITSDNNNIFVTDNTYNKVYVSRKDGSGFKCLLEKKKVVHPWGIALDKEGQLWVGCDDGKIHVIKCV